MRAFRIKAIVIILLMLIFFSGCSPKETARVLGFGLSQFKNKGKINTRTINKDFFSAYNKTVEVLTEMGAVFDRKNLKHGYIVASNFSESYLNHCIPSTEVAIFFTESGPDKVNIEVASLNFSLSDFVAQRLFSELQ